MAFRSYRRSSRVSLASVRITSLTNAKHLACHHRRLPILVTLVSPQVTFHVLETNCSGVGSILPSLLQCMLTMTAAGPDTTFKSQNKITIAEIQPVRSGITSKL